MIRLFKTASIISLLILLLSPTLLFAAEKVYFYHTDAAGTPVAMTDSSGNVVWEADYKPFGEEQEVTAFPENNKRFIGKEKDEETGLYYFGARYMDAGIGRFTKPDPVGISEGDLMNPQRFNRYVYSLNNPYRYVDPDGNTVWDIVDIGFFGHSLYKFISNPSWSTAGDLGLDAVGLLPGIPSLGSIKLVGKGLKKLDDVAEVGVKAVKKPYKRLSNATTPAQRKAVQGQPCVDCGKSAPKMVADHKKPLVKEYYETGTINKAKMRETKAVQPQCPTCSAKQGAEMRNYSIEKKKELGL